MESLGSHKVIEMTDREREEKIRRLQKEADTLRAEIAALEENEKEEEIANKTPQIEIRKTSRRSFLKEALGGFVASAGAVKLILDKNKSAEVQPKATLAQPEAIPKVQKVAKQEKNKTIEGEIEECTRIIENKEYEKILDNPYLVSALYYSEEAVDKMAPPNQNSPEKIIWNIHKLITKDFRNEYINMLKKLIVGKNLDIEKKSQPLSTISAGKNLLENHGDAIDLFIHEGSPVYTMSSGVVVLAENGWKKGDDMTTSTERGGNTVIIFDPENESFSRYAHMSTTIVRAGSLIQGGESIGIVGHTGINASQPGNGEHLHLEINRYDRETGSMMPTSVFALKRQLDALHH